MKIGSPFTCFWKETNTRQAGFLKLLTAFLVAPVLAAMLWTFPALLFAPELFSDTPEYTVGNYSFFDTYLAMFLAIWKMVMIVGTPAFLLMIFFFRSFRLYKIENLAAFAAMCPMLVILFWLLADAVTAIQGEGIVALFIAIAFMELTVGMVLALGAITVASIFWWLGIKNNHWLLSR